MGTRTRLSRERHYANGIDKMVSKLEIKFTMPQEVIVRQEDEPEVACDDNGDPCMFFIAKGACMVRVTMRNIL